MLAISDSLSELLVFFRAKGGPLRFPRKCHLRPTTFAMGCLEKQRKNAVFSQGGKMPCEVTKHERTAREIDNQTLESHPYHTDFSSGLLIF